MLSLENALEILWDWRLKSVPIEVDWFACPPGKTAAARVSLDGIITQLDASGFVTVSGEGREIELDLRSCTFRRQVPPPSLGMQQPPPSPDSLLQIDFPSGEVCLFLPYRRVAAPHPVGGKIVRGLQWSKSDLSLLLNAPEPEETPVEIPEPEIPEEKKSLPPKIVRIRPPLMPVVAVLLTIAIITLVLIPLQIPQLLVNLGFSTPRLNDPKVTVWVVPLESAYYCDGSLFYKRQPGKAMEQGQALTFGYQPALGRYCGESDFAVNRPAPGPFTQFMDNVQWKGHLFLLRLALLPRALWSHVNTQTARR